MTQNRILAVMSLLQIVFLMLHLTDDTLRARAGTPEAMGSTFVAVPVLVLWLYATLLLAERRSGLILILVLSLFSVGMPVIHMMGTYGVAGNKPEGAFRFVFGLFVLAVTGMFSMFLAADGLRARRGSRDRQELA
jgi:hypothetical protein